MELIKVNSLKLKIILTPEDMREFEITNETLDYGSAKTRKAFRSILEKARCETGFDTKNDHIYVQIFPSLDGGCEMFLTRRGRLLPEPDEQKGTYLKKKYSPVYDRQSKQYRYIAETDNIENIIKLSLRMKESGFSGLSSLYASKDKYYLTIKFPKNFPSFMKNPGFDEEHHKFAYMSDYADIYYAHDLPDAYIREHAQLILSENAISRLADSFNKQ